jgi:hypothetical protein
MTFLAALVFVTTPVCAASCSPASWKTTASKFISSRSALVTQSCCRTAAAAIMPSGISKCQCWLRSIESSRGISGGLAAQATSKSKPDRYPLSTICALARSLRDCTRSLSRAVDGRMGCHGLCVEVFEPAPPSSFQTQSQGSSPVRRFRPANRLSDGQTRLSCHHPAPRPERCARYA